MWILKAQTISELEKKLLLCTLRIPSQSHDFFMKTCQIHASWVLPFGGTGDLPFGSFSPLLVCQAHFLTAQADSSCTSGGRGAGFVWKLCRAVSRLTCWLAWGARCREENPPWPSRRRAPHSSSEGRARGPFLLCICTGSTLPWEQRREETRWLLIIYQAAIWRDYLQHPGEPLVSALLDEMA